MKKIAWFVKPDATEELLERVQQWQLSLAKANIETTPTGQADVLISVGGDGTLLHASRVAAPLNIPVIGIHQGHLGFLTTIQADEAVEKIISILNGLYISEERILLDVKLTEMGEIVREGYALNDAVLKSAEHLLTISWEVDNQPAAIWRADGVIISTPTGSTAYSLSAGGAILEPELEAITVVPLCPQTLTHRPLVVSSKRTLSFQHNHPVAQRCALDGHDVWWVQKNQKLEIKIAKDKVKILHPTKNDFYDTLRRKLGWNSVDSFGLPLPSVGLKT